MWLLSTDRAELHLFSSPEEIDDGYAALSHVWDKTEQSFQDVRKIQERCASDGTNPRDFVCEKIRRCCELAESHGYKWVWIDTCCIDKTSSTELSEAINSMFRYYALSSICYGYLRDVECPEDYDDLKWRQRLLRSIWFQRGWTLQELIAPRFFLFVSKSWEVLRSKAEFASDIQKATRIPAAVLRIEISHTTYSISQRMSWLGLRKTTRLEDEAYCLLGIFDVHMSALYGEGGNAFQRLQEAIMRQSVDTTLFAWGIEPDDPHTDDPSRSCLLARAPSAFVWSHNLVYVPLQHVWRLHLPPQQQNISESVGRDIEGAQDMSLSVTPHGVLAYIPIITYQNIVFADLFWCSEEGVAWPADHARPTSRLLLCLAKDPDTLAGPSSRRKSYIVDASRLLWIEPPQKSLEYVILGRRARGSWQTVLIRHRPPPHRLPGQLLLADPRTPFIPAVPAQLVVDTPFRFDEIHIQKFRRQFGANSLKIQQSGPMTAYIFADKGFMRTRVIVIQVGTCDRVAKLDREPQPPASRTAVWATVLVDAILRLSATSQSDAILAELLEDSQLSDTSQSDAIVAELLKNSQHTCLKDHVSNWSGYRKSFDLGDQLPERAARVSLAFTRCPINPRRTLVLEASYSADG